jgi:hypothetical protein
MMGGFEVHAKYSLENMETSDLHGINSLFGIIH